MFRLSFDEYLKFMQAGNWTAEHLERAAAVDIQQKPNSDVLRTLLVWRRVCSRVKVRILGHM